jgi:hypothetical protein
VFGGGEELTKLAGTRSILNSLAQAAAGVAHTIVAKSYRLLRAVLLTTAVEDDRLLVPPDASPAAPHLCSHRAMLLIEQPSDFQDSG